jgi:hypothetical protein
MKFYVLVRIERMKRFLIRQFCLKTQKYERGERFKVKIHILFYGDNS